MLAYIIYIYMYTYLFLKSGKWELSVCDSVWSENLKWEIWKLIDWWNRSTSVLMFCDCSPPNALCWDTFLQCWHCHILPKCSAHRQATGGQTTDTLKPVFLKVMLHCWNSVKDLLRWILCNWSKWNLTQEAIASDEPAEAQIGIVQCPSDCITHFFPAIRETDRKQKSWTNPRISKSKSLRYDQPGLCSKVFVNLSHQLSGELSGGLECNGFCFGKP